MPAYRRPPEQYQQAYEMKLAGATYAEIAERFGGSGVSWNYKLLKLFPDLRNKKCGCCGELFNSKGSGRGNHSYCSTECAEKVALEILGRITERRKTSVSSLPWKAPRICRVCSKEFLPIRSNQLTCRGRCQALADKLRKARCETEKRQAVPRKTAVCPVCSAVFLLWKGGTKPKWCSHECRKQSPEYKEQHRRAVQKRRAIKIDAFVEEVYFEEIAMRDGWKCQLCGKKVDKKAKHPALWSPVLDHIIPLFEGGTHEPKNVQLAHNRCNAQKGSKARGQLRFLG